MDADIKSNLSYYVASHPSRRTITIGGATSKDMRAYLSQCGTYSRIDGQLVLRVDYKHDYGQVLQTIKHMMEAEYNG